MIHTVKDFPIYHHYLTSILLEVGLAEGAYSQLLENVSEYCVTGRCECGDETCNTVHLKSESLRGREGTYCFGFNVGYVIFNFYDDGVLEVESLADCIERNFPFKQELDDVFGSKDVKYDDTFAQLVVKKFMRTLKRVDVETVVV